MIKFEKVSKEIFINDYIKYFSDIGINNIEKIYNNIKLPKRATTGSAGYDFYSPFSFNLEPTNQILIPTGIRAQMNNDLVLLMFPRSSLGFKYKLRLDNTIGVIDSDYYYSDNEGHILIKITNENNTKPLLINQNEAFSQGIFIKYYTIDDDDTTNIRNGGIGSTNEN